METGIILRTDSCTGCGDCVEACRRGVLRLADTDRGRIVQVADAERCAGCRACERRCPRQAIAVRKTEGRKADPKRLLQGILPVVLAVGLTLPWSTNPAGRSGINYWKLFGLFVLFHILFCHVRIPKILKNTSKNQ